MNDDRSKPHSQDWRSGRVYHITTATHQRLPVFSDFHAARLSIRALREAQTREDATTLLRHQSALQAGRPSQDQVIWIIPR